MLMLSRWSWIGGAQGRGQMDTSIYAGGDHRAADDAECPRTCSGVMSVQFLAFRVARIPPIGRWARCRLLR